MRRILSNPLNFIILMACSLSGGAGAACQDPGFASLEGYPGEAIALSGIPASSLEVYADVEVDSDDQPALGLVTVNTDEEYYLIVPIHPDGLPGGVVEVTIQGDDFVCTSVEIEILPLQTVSGAFLEYLQDLRAYFDLTLQNYGVDRDVLLNGDLNQLSPFYLPLAFAQFLLDSPDNPNSLEHFLDGSAEVLQGTPLNLELIDAITAKLSLSDLVTEMTTQLRQDITQRNLSNRVVSTYPAPSSSQYALPLNGSIVSVGELSQAMSAQQTCMRRLTGATGQLLNDMDLASAVIGLIYPPAGTAIGLALLIHKAPTEACAFLNPSSFAGMRMEVTIDSFEEDYPGDDGQSPVPGKISNVWVTPRSEIWKIAGLMIDTAMTAAGGLDAALDAGRLARDGVGIISGGGQMSVNNIQTINESLAPAANNICGRSEACTQYLPNIEVNNNPWNEVSIFGKDWVEVNYLGDAIQPADGFGTYLPRAVGIGTLDVWTAKGKFGSAAIRVQQDIEVLMIDVDIDPDGPTLSPGQTQCFNVTVQNAIDTEVEWILQGPEGSSSLGTGEQACFTAPDFPLVKNPDECKPPRPITKTWSLTAASLASGGLRATSNELRYDEVLIGVRKVALNWQRPDDCEPKTDVCLLGIWVLDNSSYLRFLQAAGGGGGDGGVFTEVSGAMFTTYYEDNSVTTSSEGFSITLCTSEGCLTIPVKQSGSGEYDVEGDQLYTDGSSTTIATVAVPIIGERTGEATSSGASATFACTGNSLEINANGYGLPSLLWQRADE